MKIIKCSIKDQNKKDIARLNGVIRLYLSNEREGVKDELIDLSHPP